MGLTKIQLSVIAVTILSITSKNKVDSFEAYQYVFDYNSPGNLDFSRGDVICCRIETSLGSRIYGAEHVMFATDSSSVTHIEANGKDFSKGNLREDNFIEMTNQHGYGSCRVATTQYDRIMFDKGVIPLTNRAGVNSARWWIQRGTGVYYDFTGCNCQHWVTEWKYGKAWSVQSNQPPNRRCPLINYFSASLMTHAGAYSDSGQVGARAGASLGQASGGSGVFSGVAGGPSVEAHAEAGKHFTGAGFKASVGEIRGNIGNSFGASLGLSADTGLGCGIDGCGIQVIGTGVQYSRSKGTKICLFGSCLYVNLG